MIERDDGCSTTQAGKEENIIMVLVTIFCVCMYPHPFPYHTYICELVHMFISCRIQYTCGVPVLSRKDLCL